MFTGGQHGEGTLALVPCVRTRAPPPLEAPLEATVTAPTAPETAPVAVGWQDEAAFHAADPRRAQAPEVELGATWRRAGSDDAWRLAWLETTGELFLARVDGFDSRDVTVVAVVPDAQQLDALLDGWRDHRDDEDGLSWLASRVTPAPRSAA